MVIFTETDIGMFLTRVMHVISLFDNMSSLKLDMGIKDLKLFSMFTVLNFCL